MAKLASYQWLYVLLMISAIVVSSWGIVVTIALARGKPNAYRDALIVLVVSMILAGVQTFVSIALRGKGAPQNMRFYLTTLVLIVFLLLRLPPHLEADRRLCAQREARLCHAGRAGRVLGRADRADDAAVGRPDAHRPGRRPVGECDSNAAVVGRRAPDAGWHQRPGVGRADIAPTRQSVSAGSRSRIGGYMHG